MKMIAALLVTASLAAPAMAVPAGSPQLPPIDAGSILAQIEQQDHFQVPQPIISTDMQFALEAASELRKELKGYGIKAKVGLVNEPKGGYGLWVEFRNWADYEKVKDLFYQDPGDNPSYMSHKVYPRVPKGVDRGDMAWKSVRLQAAEGTRIIVDYSLLNLGGTMLANPVWITVADKAFSGSEKVRVAVMTYYEATSSSPEALKETRELSLEYNGTAFQAKGPELSIYEGHHAWTHHFRQEIAVSVNGRWLTDPVNGSHNFRFKLGSREADTKAGGEKIKACWLKGMEKDVCVYKCKDGSTYTQPMQRPLPWNDTPVIPCPQLVFPF